MKKVKMSFKIENVDDQFESEISLAEVYEKGDLVLAVYQFQRLLEAFYGDDQGIAGIFDETEASDVSDRLIK